MTVPICSTCGAELAPSELPACFTCRASRPTTIGQRALMILEQATSPLSYWDIQRLMGRASSQVPLAGSLLVYLSRDLRICWAGKGKYGLYRHGLVPNVRGLGPAAEVHLLTAPAPVDLDELHFVLQHQGYRYQLASLRSALERHMGASWRWTAGLSDSEAARVRQERRLGQLLQISRRSPHFQDYQQELRNRVANALTERTRRLQDHDQG